MVQGILQYQMTVLLISLTCVLVSIGVTVHFVTSDDSCSVPPALGRARRGWPNIKSIFLSMEVINSTTFSVVLSAPFEPFIELLAKTGSNVPFIIPKRLAGTGARVSR